MVWAKNGTPHTLTSDGDTITISDLTATNFNVVLTHQLYSANSGANIIFDNDTGSVYAERSSINGGTDGTSTSIANIIFMADNTKRDHFGIGYISNISGEETLVMCFAVDQGTAGAGNAPNRREIVGKDAGTVQFTRIDLTNENPGVGDFLTDSNLSVLGSDGVESMTVQDGAIYYDTDLNKEYVLYDNAWTEV